MAKKIKQFRFYGDSGNNYPSQITYRNLVSGAIFSNYIPIVQLGIQTLPGTKFYINGSTNPVIIGTTGIYELNLSGLTEINSLQFDASSLSLISQNETAGLIIDIIHEGSGT